MTKVIKQNDKYLTFETFVRDLDVLVQVEHTSYINLATEFIDVQDAAEYIRIAKNSGYDTNEYTVVDKEQIIKDEKDTRENEKNAKLKQLWDSSNEEGKRALLTSINEDDRKEFLVRVGDTSGIQPYSNEELQQRKIERLEKTLGITFTEEQKEILRNKEDL
jgi:hypothetical protein